MLLAAAKQSPARPEVPLTDPLADAFGLTAEQQSAIALVKVNGKGRCTGVLIERRHVLTAKHCLRDAKDVAVQFTNRRDTSWTRIRVSKVDRHPRMDAALLWLTGAMTDASPATSSSAGPHTGTTVLAAGYGELSAFTERHSVRFFKGVLNDIGDELIVDYGGSLGPCRGDSGGPLFLVGHGGHALLAGILRGGSPSCRGPDRFVMMDELIPWIDDRVVSSRKEVKL